MRSGLPPSGHSSWRIPGIDLQRQLTSSGTDLPVMFMTAIGNEDTRQEAFDAGCIAYLKKPFLAKRLIDAINRIVTTIY
jgi:FixJ family two-component response regulator